MDKITKMTRESGRLFKVSIKTARGSTSGESAYGMRKSRRLRKFAKKLKMLAKRQGMERMR